MAAARAAWTKQAAETVRSDRPLMRGLFFDHRATPRCGSPSASGTSAPTCWSTP